MLRPKEISLPCDSSWDTAPGNGLCHCWRARPAPCQGLSTHWVTGGEQGACCHPVPPSSHQAWCQRWGRMSQPPSSPAPRALQTCYQAGSHLHLLYGLERKGEAESGQHWQKYCCRPLRWLAGLLARGDNTAAFVRPPLCKWIRLPTEARPLSTPDTTFLPAQGCGHCWAWPPHSAGTATAVSPLRLPRLVPGCAARQPTRRGMLSLPTGLQPAVKRPLILISHGGQRLLEITLSLGLCGARGMCCHPTPCPQGSRAGDARGCAAAP